MMHATPRVVTLMPSTPSFAFSFLVPFAKLNDLGFWGKRLCNSSTIAPSSCTSCSTHTTLSLHVRQISFRLAYVARLLPHGAFLERSAPIYHNISKSSNRCHLSTLEKHSSLACRRHRCLLCLSTPHNSSSFPRGHSLLRRQRPL